MPPASKRSSNELARMSFSASFLDATADTSTTTGEINKRTALENIKIHESSFRHYLVFLSDKDDVKSPVPTCDLSKMSPRHYTALELLQTETNYVSILSTITNVCKYIYIIGL